MDSFAYLVTLEKFGIKFGLENIRKLCAALGEPQRKYRSALIAGTNGKGSVTAMVDRGLRAAGIKVGRYTSPHLIHLEERFAIDGDPVDSRTLEGVIEKIRTMIDRLLADGVLEAPPTFFEVTTAVAFEIFGLAGVEFAVLEVGLGGRLDSTNCVEPVAAAITSIAFDHEQYLGHTLGAIAAEKAGVIRSGIPVVVGPLEPEPRQVIASLCAEAGARLVDSRDGIELDSTTIDGRTSIRLKTAAADYGWIPLGLRGSHQIPNAVVAVRLLEELSQLFAIGSDAIVIGLRDVRWPGRLQCIEMDRGRRVLLDAAHNPAGIAALVEYLREHVRDPLPVVFGAMRDKNATDMIKALLPVAAAFVMTEPGNSRARSAGELASTVRTLAPNHRVEIEPQPMAALQLAWQIKPMVCAAGSIFLIGDLLKGLDGSPRNA